MNATLLLTMLLVAPAPVMQVTGVGTIARLSWTEVTDDRGQVFYNVYRGTKPDCSDCVKLNTTPISCVAYDDTNAQVGLSYGVKAYVVTSSSTTDESVFSNISILTVPEDVDRSGSVNVLDVQKVINKALQP